MGVQTEVKTASLNKLIIADQSHWHLLTYHALCGLSQGCHLWACAVGNWTPSELLAEGQKWDMHASKFMGVSAVPAFFVWGIGGLGMPRTWREKVAGSMLRLKLTAKGKGSTLTQCCAEAVVNLSLVITYTKSYLIPSCSDRVCLEGEVWKQFDPQGPNCWTNSRVEPKFDSHGQVLGLFRYQKFGVV